MLFRSGYTTWFWLMRTYSAASLHSFTFLTPVFGVIAGSVLLGERIGGAVLGGMLLFALALRAIHQACFAGPITTLVDKLVPELRRRGLFRSEYEGATLRENLGLARPADISTRQRAARAAE